MNNAIAVGIGFVLAGIIILAITHAPETDNCTPRLIAKYTNEMISHQECETMPRCIIEPSDIRDFHNAQINFRQCVMKVVGESQKKAEEGKEE